MMNASHNPNRSLVHIFCLSLSGLLVLYSAIAIYDLVTRESVTAEKPGTFEAKTSGKGFKKLASSK